MPFSVSSFRWLRLVTLEFSKIVLGRNSRLSYLPGCGGGNSLISESRMTDTKPHYESNHHAAPRARIPVDLGWGGRLERCDSERCDSAGASGC